jgi:hypothetical protein
MAEWPGSRGTLGPVPFRLGHGIVGRDAQEGARASPKPLLGSWR